MREISVTRNFQEYFSRTFQDQSDFPGLTRSGILKKKSRTFQEAWEPFIILFAMKNKWSMIFYVAALTK